MSTNTQDCDDKIFYKTAEGTPEKIPVLLAEGVSRQGVN